MKTALFVGLVLVAIPYLVALVGAAARARAASRTGEDAPAPTPLGLAVGFVTNFFDTLGIGSFAPTTAIFKLRRPRARRADPGHAERRATPRRRSPRR